MAFAVGNLLGPLTLWRLFYTVGRRKMISGTYILSAYCWPSAPNCSVSAR